jgi:hypothetical protein
LLITRPEKSTLLENLISASEPPPIVISIPLLSPTRMGVLEAFF